ncbi:MAG: VTT domain-containing protein [Candidatus Bathyarchaeota archaeon]|nr:VTT domain-containing protein [Candidatus Bathyarchaeota archaeon]
MKQFAYQYSYLGVFLVSLIGALSVVFPIPYTIIIYLLGRSLDPYIIAIAGGLGSALGELSGYILGYYGRAVVSEERKRKMDFMLRIFNRYGAAAIFVFALTPLPDDLLFIPLGIMRYKFVKAFIPTILGKTLMCFTLAMGGRLSVTIIEGFLGEGGWVEAIITTVFLILVIVIILKVDWEEVFTQYVETRKKKNEA